MSPIVASLNFYLALGGVVALLGAVILIVDLYREQALKQYVERFGLYLALLVSFLSATMALVYSEYFGFIPCGLCWLERMFLFPQVVLLLGALYFRDALVARYGLILSAIGGVIALYHHYIQMGGAEFVRCPASGAASCAQRILFEFGFVTFPLLAFAGFAFLGALYFYILKVAVSR